MKQRIIVKNIKQPLTAPLEFAFESARRRLSLNTDEFIRAELHKRSIDARRRNGDVPSFVMSVTVECEIDERKLAYISRLGSDYEIVKKLPMEVTYGNKKLNARPIVVGFGPAGMFAALLLAEHGYAPIVFERGSDVKERSKAVERFISTGLLDTETNIQFGAGGAGTFSDGKLVTRINDSKCEYVLRRFYEFGAPEEIMWLAKPHIGTDKLLSIVENIANRIISLGGEIRYNTRLDDIEIKDRQVTSVTVTHNGEREQLCADAVILALGHSARDTYEMLSSKGILLETKPFSVGVRVEHLQSDIDYALYGEAADICSSDGKRILPAGEYTLSYRESKTAKRGVYSFCMCPGGEVMASASEEGGVVTNGMSRYLRDGKNANAAIAVSVLPEDLSGGWRGGVEFQRMLEQAAYKAADTGEHDYRAPVETLGDFLDSKTSNFTKPGRVIPTYRNGVYTLTDMSKILPSFVTDMLKVGFCNFGRKIKGFDAKDTILTGVETRTSSPVRIPRGEGRTSVSADNVYPCGEGAGYAGGITSAAVDGINTVIKLMSEYAPKLL